MTIRRVLLVPAIAVSVCAATPAARAGVVAGWDFSQYFGAGLLSTDGSTFVETLPANYSEEDPTANAGSESAAFGTMYLDGTFGSTAVGAGSGTESFVPTSRSLVSNLDAPADAIGTNPFDSHTVLRNEGQTSTELLSMTARAATNAVFRADLTSVPATGSNWRVSFAGKTFSGSSTVGVEFSTDGSGYSNAGSVDLTTTDATHQVFLASAASETAYVRLNFPAPAGGGVNQAIIDNVAISVPEPGSLGLALGLAAGLAGCARRRRTITA